MGIKKEWYKKQQAEKHFSLLKDSLFESLKPYFAFSGKLDLSVNDPSVENADTLARILNAIYKLTSKKNTMFGADSILAQQVIIDEHKILKYWERYSGYKLLQTTLPTNRLGILFMENFN